MQSRFLKQFIYGIFYLVIFGALGYGIFNFAFDQAPTCKDGIKNGNEEEIDCGGSECLSCDLNRLKPILITGVSIFNLGGTEANALVFLRNPNVEYGAENFSYTLTLYNELGETLLVLPKTSFIYPGEIKFFVEAGIPVSGATRGEVSISSVSWKSRDTFVRPDVKVRDITIELRADRREAAASGVFKNASPVALSRIVLNVALMGPEGIAVAAGKTVLQNLSPSEERPFRVIVPSVPLASVSREAVSISLEAVQ